MLMQDCPKGLINQLILVNYSMRTRQYAFQQCRAIDWVTSVPVQKLGVNVTARPYPPSVLQNSTVRLLPTFRCLWLDFVTCLFTVFHARACSGRAQPTPPVTCKTDVLQVAPPSFMMPGQRDAKIKHELVPIPANGFIVKMGIQG